MSRVNISNHPHHRLRIWRCLCFDYHLLLKVIGSHLDHILGWNQVSPAVGRNFTVEQLLEVALTVVLIMFGTVFY